MNGGVGCCAALWNVVTNSVANSAAGANGLDMGIPSSVVMVAIITDNLNQMTESALSFTAFVYSLATSAAIHFGDLPDPMSGTPGELNLAGAAQMIEILALLDQKTRGNLTAEERQMLDQALYELRLRFVEASGGGKRIIEP